MGIEETEVTISKRDIGVSHDHISLPDVHNEHNLKANNIMAHSNPNLKRKRHIAIDVETERGIFNSYIICLFICMDMFIIFHLYYSQTSCIIKYKFYPSSSN